MRTIKLTATKKLLAERIKLHKRPLREWYLAHSKNSSPAFYCSVDLRDSGDKIVPVDSNLFPAGFNNICPEDLRAAPAILKSQIEARFGATEKGIPKKILILPEAHTQNTYYIENLYYLCQIFQNAGFELKLGWYGQPGGAPQTTPVELVSETGKTLIAHPIEVNQGTLSISEFVPDLIILNNDFSSGYPVILDQVLQPILPSHTLGWHSRKKSEHFVHYNRLAREFAALIDIDPWLISVDTEEVSPVNFNEDQGIEEVAQAVQRILDRTRAAYATHKIKQEPFAFVKNNHGTYGMGIMVVHSAEELRQMNRRAKNKMSVGKNRLPIDSVAVQEGIPTTTLVDRLAAEPVIYLMGSELIGGFLRTNTEKGAEDNLNSQGMAFKKLCMSDLRSLGDDDDTEDAPSQEPALELVYGSIARISALATGMELASHQKRVG